MKIEKFKYFKQGTTEPGDYEVVVLKESADKLEGFSLGRMSEAEQDTLRKLIKDFEEKTKPFMKYYRAFKKQQMIIS